MRIERNVPLVNINLNFAHFELVFERCLFDTVPEIIQHKTKDFRIFIHEYLAVLNLLHFDFA